MSVYSLQDIKTISLDDASGTATDIIKMVGQVTITRNTEKVLTSNIGDGYRTFKPGLKEYELVLSALTFDSGLELEQVVGDFNAPTATGGKRTFVLEIGVTGEGFKDTGELVIVSDSVAASGSALPQITLKAASKITRSVIA